MSGGSVATPARREGDTEMNASAQGFDIAINNVRLFDGFDVRSGTLSLGVRNGFIAALSEIPLTGKETLEGSGAWLSPGLIDSHVHMFDPINSTDEKSIGDYVDTVLPQHFQSFLDHGITTIKSVGDPVPELLTIRK